MSAIENRMRPWRTLLTTGYRRTNEVYCLISLATGDTLGGLLCFTGIGRGVGGRGLEEMGPRWPPIWLGRGFFIRRDVSLGRGSDTADCALRSSVRRRQTTHFMLGICKGSWAMCLTGAQGRGEGEREREREREIEREREGSK